MTTTHVPAAADAPASSILGPLRAWILERGILFAFLQAPIAALFVGFLLRSTTLPLATFLVFVSFALYPVWVSYRKSVSDDPTEPVHFLPRYALYALLPYAMFSIIRIPAHLLFGTVYWQLWYGFGAQLTGQPPGQLPSLAAGMVLYSIQGLGLAMSYYVLFKRHSLLNALLFMGVFLPALFSYIFPVFSLPGARPNATWYVVHWVSHFAMALTAWYMPRLWTSTWPRLGARRAAALIAFVLLFASPYGFALARAGLWQFQQQRRIDQAVFSRSPLLVLHDGPEMTVGAGGADYRFTLRFGPRSYTTYAHAAKALDAGPVDVAGRLAHGTQTIAWCSGHVRKLGTPNTLRGPQEFARALERLQYVDVPVDCVGPAAAATRLTSGTPVEVQWTADLDLIGDRSQQRRRLTGDQPARLRVAG
jgi:hypothetical protein